MQFSTEFTIFSTLESLQEFSCFQNHNQFDKQLNLQCRNSRYSRDEKIAYGHIHSYVQYPQGWRRLCPQYKLKSEIKYNCTRSLSCNGCYWFLRNAPKQTNAIFLSCFESSYLITSTKEMYIVAISSGVTFSALRFVPRKPSEKQLNGLQRKLKIDSDWGLLHISSTDVKF